MAEYLPPVVAQLTGDIGDFLSKIAEAEAALSALEGKSVPINVDMSVGPALAAVDAVKTDIMSIDDLVPWLDINTSIAEAKLASVDATLAKVKADAALAAAELALLGEAGGGGGGGVAPVVGIGGGGRGGGLGGLLALLGFGSAASKGLPFGGLGAGLAGFGSIGALAGLGPESMVTTALGIGGSALGGLAGAGALGLGALGVAGVGMGTDMAGLGQAANDAKSYNAALNNLNEAIAVYGANSTQAQVAQAKLNYTLAGFPTAAQPAIVALNATGQQFHDVFNQVTGAAEATGAQIIQQVIQVAQGFLPTIGKFAAENMSIIQSSLQPLLAWIQGPGLQIFTELEQIFQQHLPAAMNAFDQGVELLIKTIGFIAPQTGAIITFLSNLFTKLNGPDFGKFTGEIQKAIDIFHVWWGLIKNVGDAIYLLFTHDAGTGTAIIQMLSDMVGKFDAWARTVAGGDKLHNLLEAHKQEILAILQMMPTFLSLFGQLELAVSPALMTIVKYIAELADALIKIPGIGKILEFVIAFEILGNKIGLLKGPLGWFNTQIMVLATGALDAIKGKLLGVGAASDAMAVGEDGAAASTGVLDAALNLLAVAGIVAVAVGIYELIKHFGVIRGLLIAAAGGVAVLTAAFIILDTVPIVAVIAGIAAAITLLVIGIIELVKHFKEVSEFLKGPWGIAIAGAVVGINPLLGIAVLLIGHWQAVWDFMKGVASWFTGPFVNAFTGIPGAIDHIWNDVVGALHDAWDTVANWVNTNVIQPIINFFTGMPGRILSAVSGFGTLLLHAGEDLINGLRKGITNMAGKAVDAVKNIGKDILHSITSFFGIFSPSKVMQDVGSNITQGVAVGMQASSGQAVAIAKTLSSQIIAAFGSLSATGNVASAANSLKSIFGSLSTAFSSLATAAQKAPSVSANMGILRTALGVMAAGAPAMAAALKGVQTAFEGLTQSKGVRGISGVFGAISGMLGNFGKAVQSAGGITQTSVAQMVTALSAIQADAPMIALAVQQIVSAFTGTMNLKTVDTNMQSLSKTIGDLTNIFNDFGMMSQGAAGLSTTAMAAIIQGLQNLDDNVPAITEAITGITDQFGALGNTKSLNTQLGNLSTLFGTLDTILQEVNSTSQDAAAITPDALQQITTALGNLGGAIQTLQTAAAVATPTVIASIQDMGNQIASYFTGMIGTMASLGVNLMAGLAGGISSSAWVAIAAAESVANQVTAIVQTATQQSSPSRVFHNIGLNLMTGLANGIRAGFSSSVLPALGQVTSALTRAGGGGNFGFGGGGIAPVVAPAGVGGTVMLQVTTPIQINGQTLATAVTKYQLQGARSTGNSHGQYAGGSQSGAATVFNANAIQR